MEPVPGMPEVSELLVHRDRMCLIDRVLEVDATRAVTEVTIREDDLFCFDGEVGGWVGIELMAQTVAIWAGWQARARGEVPKIGFLLGTRRYTSHRPRFLPGDRLRIEVSHEWWSDGGLGQFACAILMESETVATAALTVYEPQDASAEVSGNE
jgi:predicted hotdog family 3-hydroxylacyl-ACP dehydratase